MTMDASGADAGGVRGSPDSGASTALDATDEDANVPYTVDGAYRCCLPGPAPHHD
jgi:hypothetical protein